MCETPGFIPRSAVGKQVRCANRECLVPVFTAPESADGKPTRVPARISDGEVAAGKTGSKPAGQKNPMVMYGIVGGILLVLTVGLVWFLNKPGITELGPVVIQPGGGNGEDEPEDPDEVPGGTPPAAVQVDHRKAALQLVDQMIQAARVNIGNSNKALCRRLTGDAYLRLGQETQARAEFDQLKVVSSQRGQEVGYYRLGPLITQYWALREAGENDAAAAILVEARELGAVLPAAVGLAMESAVSLAAALADSGDLTAGLEVVAQQQRDASVTSFQDSARYGAWNSCATVLWDAGHDALTPQDAFSWQEPLMTAVCVHLAVEGRWDTAVQWVAAQQASQTASDSCAALAAQMVALNAPASVRDALAAAAEAKGRDVSLRTNSVLATSQNDQQYLARAKQQFASLTSAEPAALGSVLEVIDVARPDLSGAALTSSAVADYAAAAATRGDMESAAAALQRLAGIMLSVVPPTAEIRRAAGEIERNDDAVKDRIADELNITNSNRLRSRFIAYRKSIDQLARAAEERRLLLLQMLSQVVQKGGLNAVRDALKQADSALTQEIGVDRQSGMLYVAATVVDLDYPEILTLDAALAVPPARVETDEQTVMPVLVSAWQKYRSGAGLAAAAELDSVTGLPGLRSAMVIEMTTKSVSGAESVVKMMETIQQIPNELWREQCMAVATRLLAERGMAEQLEAAMGQVNLTPTQRVSALHALVLSRIQAEKASPDQSAEPAVQSGGATGTG